MFSYVDSGLTLIDPFCVEHWVYPNLYAYVCDDHTEGKHGKKNKNPIQFD
jgi:hypothetical protein